MSPSTTASAGWDDQVRYAVPGGVDVVLEAVGGDTLHRCLGLLAPSGRAVVFGAAAGELTSVPVTEPVRAEERDRVLAAGLARGRSGARSGPTSPNSPAGSGTGKLRAVTGATLPLAEVSRAHRLLEERSVLGRLLLVP